MLDLGAAMLPHLAFRAVTLRQRARYCMYTISAISDRAISDHLSPPLRSDRDARTSSSFQTIKLRCGHSSPTPSYFIL